ncbi:MAG: nitroreductase [Desulfobacterales bacterium]|nr:nitroreductase [Desulfobacterales bacterium]
MDIISAMKERRSVRAFSDKPVSREDIETVIAAAGLAPSAINLQPWEFIVTYGEEKERLVRRLKKAHAERKVSCGPGTAKPLPQKYTERSRKALAVMEPKISQTGMPFNRFIEDGSCSFYGAPIAIIVAIDRVFPSIRYLDVGMSVSYLLLAAQAKGLSTCPIGLIVAYADDIVDVLNISSEKEILLGISMGYADQTAPANDFKTGREDLSKILSWYE